MPPIREDALLTEISEDLGRDLDVARTKMAAAEEAFNVAMHDSKVQDVIESLSQPPKDLTESLRPNPIHDPNLSGFHLLKIPKDVGDMIRHRAVCRGRILALEKFFKLLKEVKTDDDLLRAYEETLSEVAGKAEYASTIGRQEVATKLRSRLEDTLLKRGVAAAPQTQTATSAQHSNSQ